MIDYPQFWFAIPVFNRVELTLSCLESIRKQRYKNYVIVICDDGTTDNTAMILTEKYPEVRIIQGDDN